MATQMDNSRHSIHVAWSTMAKSTVMRFRDVVGTQLFWGRRRFLGTFYLLGVSVEFGCFLHSKL